MYGYVRPDKGELRVREYELFRAVYCGLCQTLRQRYGFLSRFAVNYDMTFLAMVLLSSDAGARQMRCPVHPMKKRPCVCDSRALEAAADYSVILAWWNLRDNARDEKALKALLSDAGAGAMKKAYEKAAAARPAFAANTKRCLEELNALEAENCPSLDRAADCFARILAFAADEFGDGEQRRTRREVFYHIGRLVYVLDAVDDVAGDVKEDKYNPLRSRMKEGEDKLSEAEQDALRGTVNLSQRSAAAALALRTADPWQSILENIVTVGLPEVAELVFSGKWNRREKSAGRISPGKE